MSARSLIAIGFIGSLSCLPACGSGSPQPRAPAVVALSPVPAPIPPAQPTLSGTISEIDGGPLAGVSVAVVPGPVETFTDADGSSLSLR